MYRLRCAAVCLVVAWTLGGAGRAAWCDNPGTQLLIAPATGPADLLSAVPATLPTDNSAGPTDLSAGPASTTRPSPAASAILDSLGNHYAALHSLRVAGSITGRFDVDGRTSNPSVRITGSFLAPNRFEHESESDIQLGATGQKLYMYAPAGNQYVLDDGPAGRMTPDDSASLVVQVLNEQNPSLAMAASEHPTSILTQDATAVDRGDDAIVNGQSCPTLRIAQSDSDMTVTIDPKTQLVQSVAIDMTRGFLRQGARTVKSAVLTIAYTTIEPDASITADAFAWTPPPGSRESHPANDATALVGKAPPAFRLKAIDGTTVSSTALRGKVAVLNFFATWCGPCVGEMPELDKMYRQFASQGLCWYEIDEGESQQTVRSFMAAKGLTMPVLLDDSSTAGGAYGVLGIPQTVIVGADGRIRKVIVGADPESILREIQAAMAAGR